MPSIAALSSPPQTSLIPIHMIVPKTATNVTMLIRTWTASGRVRHATITAAASVSGATGTGASLHSVCRSGTAQRQDRGALLRRHDGQGPQVGQDGWAYGFGERAQDGSQVDVRGLLPEVPPPPRPQMSEVPQGRPPPPPAPRASSPTDPPSRRWGHIGWVANGWPTACPMRPIRCRGMTPRPSPGCPP